MMHTPFYDPSKSYEDNYDAGPFGEFANSRTWKPDVKSVRTLFEIPVDFPFGIPAGPLLNGKFVQAAFAKGFPICVYKTVRSEAYPCHPHPNVLSVHLENILSMERAKRPVVADEHYVEPLSITNSFGVPSKDPSVWQEDLATLVRTTEEGKLVIGSFQGTPTGSEDAFVKDCVATAKLVKETGVKVIEMNLSCPNEGKSNLLCFDIERTEKVVAAVKDALGNIPLIVKIAYFQDDEQLSLFVTRVGQRVDGIAAINTIPAPIVNAKGEQALPGEKRAVSGICGDAIRWAGLEMVSRLSQLRSEHSLSFSIIGVGGVMNSDHYLEYRKKGADAVMSATGAMWNPFLAQEVWSTTKGEV